MVVASSCWITILECHLWGILCSNWLIEFGTELFCLSGVVNLFFKFARLRGIVYIKFVLNDFLVCFQRNFHKGAFCNLDVCDFHIVMMISRIIRHVFWIVDDHLADILYKYEAASYLPPLGGFQKHKLKSKLSYCAFDMSDFYTTWKKPKWQHRICME